MKIAQLVCAYPPYRSGIGTVAKNISKILKHRGQELTVFTLKTKYHKDKKDEDIIFLKPWLRFGNAAFAPGITWELKNYDVVYLHYPFFGMTELIFVAKLLQKKKFKLIIHYHMDTLDFNWFRKIFSLPSRLIRKKLFSLADRVVCASLDYVSNSDIKDIYNQMPDKFKEVPFSVDTDFFVPANKGKAKDEDIVITCVGGMDKAHNFKGIDILLQSFAGLRTKNTRLNLVGNGDMIREYKKIAGDLGISKRVKFFTNVGDKELVAKYQASDIFVLPSINRHEAFGIVLLEAMSCAVPLVASDLPGVRKVFEDKKHGLLARPGDRNDLKDKLEELIGDKSKRNTMGANGRQYVQEKYAIPIIEDKLANAILLN